jgi:hypothetical protein
MLLIAQTETAWDLALAVPTIRDLRTTVNGGDWSDWKSALVFGAIQLILVGTAIAGVLRWMGRQRSVPHWIGAAVGITFGQVVGLALLSLPWLGTYPTLQADWDRAIKWNFCFFFESWWSAVAAILGLSASWLSVKHLGVPVDRLYRRMIR